MPDGDALPASTDGRIGPNAILQLEAPLDALMGQGVMAEVLELCGVPKPTGRTMIEEAQVARVHETLWRLFPDQAREVSEAAGQGTARYIRAHRIPRVARTILRVAPKGWAELRLARAISDHAWTFCGSGHLAVEREGTALHFVVSRNPLAVISGPAAHPCYWHAAVFAELFSSLLGGKYTCVEESCRGCGGTQCRFVLRRGRKAGHFKGLKF